MKNEKPQNVFSLARPQALFRLQHAKIL